MHAGVGLQLIEEKKDIYFLNTLCKMLLMLKGKVYQKFVKLNGYDIDINGTKMIFRPHGFY